MSAEVIHGDCLEVMRGMSDANVDAIVTDPPYGLGGRLAGGTWGAKYGSGLEWDASAPDVAWLLDRASKVAIWGGNYFVLPPSRGWLAWCKPDALRTMGSVELCWTNQDRTAKHVLHSIAATNKERCGHPTQKPVEVMARTLEFLKLSPNSLILDPFCGSGTTGVAAVKAGHRFIGIEREAAYVEIARKRISDAQAQLTLVA